MRYRAGIAVPSANGSETATSRGHRRDIEGLRATAVLGVVLYHAGFTPLAGGYAGVDVFFVLSGFLITGGLWDELRDHGRIRFGAFYARRARRLLPAAALVIAVTMLAAARWSAPLAARSVVHDGIASLFYVANYRFALLNTNYLSASAAPSPLLHYWSLAVEEQFYLVWPALLMLGATVWRRRRHRHRRRAEPLAGVAVTIAAVTVASFALSLRLTRTNEPWAFFSLGTRAWELGVGAMLALAAPWLAKVPAALGRVLALVGLAAVMVAFTAFSSATPFPGLAALLPVLGTAAAVPEDRRPVAPLPSACSCDARCRRWGGSRTRGTCGTSRCWCWRPRSWATRWAWSPTSGWWSSPPPWPPSPPWPSRTRSGMRRRCASTRAARSPSPRSRRRWF